MSPITAVRPLLLAGRPALSVTGVAATRSVIPLLRHNSTNAGGVEEKPHGTIARTSQNESSKAINNAYSDVAPEIPIDHATRYTPR